MLNHLVVCAEYFVAKWNVQPGSTLDSGEYLAAFRSTGVELSDILLVGYAKVGEHQRAAQRVAETIQADAKGNIFLVYSAPEIDYKHTFGEGVSQGQVQRLSESERASLDQEILVALGRPKFIIPRYGEL